MARVLEQNIVEGTVVEALHLLMKADGGETSGRHRPPGHALSNVLPPASLQLKSLELLKRALPPGDQAPNTQAFGDTVQPFLAAGEVIRNAGV